MDSVRTPQVQCKMMCYISAFVASISGSSGLGLIQFTASIQHPASSIQHPASSIQYPVSSIQHRVSSIQHPASSIQHRVSSIQYPVFRFWILDCGIRIVLKTAPIRQLNQPINPINYFIQHRVSSIQYRASSTQR